jgi:hypothetical protein
MDKPKYTETLIGMLYFCMRLFDYKWPTCAFWSHPQTSAAAAAAEQFFCRKLIIGFEITNHCTAAAVINIGPSVS